MTSNGNAELNRSLLHLLHRAGQYAEVLFEKELGGAGITPRQLAVLIVVAENAGLSQTGIVERTGIDRSTLAALVRRLSTKGLLHRRRTKDDARAYAINLTDDGTELLRKAGPLARKVDHRIVQALEAGKDDFLHQLRDVIRTFQPASTS